MSILNGWGCCVDFSGTILGSSLSIETGLNFLGMIIFGSHVLYWPHISWELVVDVIDPITMKTPTADSVQTLGLLWGFLLPKNSIRSCSRYQNSLPNGKPF